MAPNGVVQILYWWATFQIFSALPFLKFKESALRKQSLYLKFDPLLKESPKKTGVDGGNSGFSLPRPSLAIRSVSILHKLIQINCLLIINPLLKCW